MGSLYHPKVKRKNRDGSITVYKDPIWWATYNVNGRRIRRSTERMRKGEAERQLLKWEAGGDVPKQASQVVAQPARPTELHGDVTLEELLNDYVESYELNELASVDQARCYRKRLLARWPGWLAKNLKTAEILLFRKPMKDEGYANASVIATSLR